VNVEPLIGGEEGLAEKYTYGQGKKGSHTGNIHGREIFEQGLLMPV
jgi:hypothetical protein